MAKRKRKPAKKPAKSRKKTQKKKTKAAVKRLKFRCVGGTCKGPAFPNNKMKGGATVKLLASGTNATLDFRPPVGNGSPFKPGGNVIHLVDGVEQTKTVVKVETKQEYPYRLSCGSCAGGAAAPPKMIVDP